MKILFVCGAGQVYGKEIVTLSLMQGLRARGHSVRCIISSWARDDFDRRLEAQGIPFIKLPLGFLSRTWSPPAVRMTADTLSKSPRLWRGYRRCLKEFQPDVVVHSTLHHVCHLWPLLNPRNTFFHVHDPFAPTKFYRRLFRLLSLRVRGFIGVSRYIEQAIIDLGVPPAKVSSVLNGLTPPVNGQAAGQLSHNGSDPPSGDAAPVRIGIVGQIGEWKGHDDFVEALKGLKAAGLPFSAVIFGAGAAEYITALKEKIAHYQLTVQVRWAGFVKNPGEIFPQMDICVVPSRSQDPCPTVAIETAHFGVPVVATRRGGLPELVRDGETGYLVEAAAPAELAAKLKLLIQHTALRRQMAAAAKAYGAAHLTGERMAAQMEATLLQAIGAQASG